MRTIKWQRATRKARKVELDGIKYHIQRSIALGHVMESLALSQLHDKLVALVDDPRFGAEVKQIRFDALLIRYGYESPLRYT